MLSSHSINFFNLFVSIQSLHPYRELSMIITLLKKDIILYCTIYNIIIMVSCYIIIDEKVCKRITLLLVLDCIAYTVMYINFMHKL